MNCVRITSICCISPQVAAPPVPHGGEAPERGGRAAAGGVARHAGGVHRATRRAAGQHCSITNTATHTSSRAAYASYQAQDE